MRRENKSRSVTIKVVTEITTKACAVLGTLETFRFFIYSKMCTTSESKKASGCILILLSLSVIPALLINYAFSYYKVVSKEDLIDGKCYVYNSTIQERDSMYTVRMSTGKEYRAYFDVDFEGGEYKFTHVAAIPATWQGKRKVRPNNIGLAGWASSNAHKYLKDYSKHKWHRCVASKHTISYDANDKDSTSYLVILGHTAHELRRNFRGLLFSGVLMASLIFIGIVHFLVNFLRRKYSIRNQYYAIN